MIHVTFMQPALVMHANEAQLLKVVHVQKATYVTTTTNVLPKANVRVTPKSRVTTIGV